jgi:hypothetical protein
MKGGFMTPEERLFAQHWAEFIQTFPSMKEHVVWARFQPDVGPEMALDAKALITFIRWCLTKDYGNRERLREMLRFFEQQTGGTNLDRESSPP